MVVAVVVEGDHVHQAAVVVRVHVPDVEVILVVTPEVVLNHVDVPRVRVQLIRNHIPVLGRIRDGPMIDHVQGKYKFIYYYYYTTKVLI